MPRCKLWMHFNISACMLCGTITFSPLKRIPSDVNIDLITVVPIIKANTQMECFVLHQAIQILQPIVTCEVGHLLWCFALIGLTWFQKLVIQVYRENIDFKLFFQCFIT